VRHVIESCDGPDCGKTREFQLKGSNAPPQDGWFALHIATANENRPHVTKSACSAGCAAAIVSVTLQLNGKEDVTVDFCPGHKDGHGGH
jgi:hypothetical protein